jgi:hypothetical protein
MTYNFDAEAWYRRQRDALEARHASGELSEEEYREALDDLERRYEEMLDRLDGTFRVE